MIEAADSGLLSSSGAKGQDLREVGCKGGNQAETGVSPGPQSRASPQWGCRPCFLPLGRLHPCRTETVPRSS